MSLRPYITGLLLNTTLLPIMALAGLTSPPSPTLDEQVRELIQRHKLTGDPAAGRKIPSIKSPEAQLGKLLFFNKGLGGDKDSACVSCHHPLLGGGDDLSLPIGTGAINPNLLGPSRRHATGKPTVPRNSPTTFNTVLLDSFLFWDGRIESLAKIPKNNGENGGIRTPESKLGIADPLAGSNLVNAQARFPVTSQLEMRGSYLENAENRMQAVRDHLAGRLGGYINDGTTPLLYSQHWVKLFEQVYGKADSVKELITEQRIFRAIGEYERSQLFVNNPWNAYVKGDTRAISPAAKRGALLFYRRFSEGGVNCAACHSGDRFTDEKFHNIAAPQIGPGTRGGINNTGDIGRANETGLFNDMFTFKTPTLLNIEGTAPYTHAGAYLTLTDMIKHYLNPREAIMNYDIRKLQRLNPQIDTKMMSQNTWIAYYYLVFAQIQGRSPLRDATLSKWQISDLESFLRSLTDPCIKSATCLAPWIDNTQEPNKLNIVPEFSER